VGVFALRALDPETAELGSGATPITPAAAGVDAMATDIANLIGAIGDAGIDPSDTVFVAPPRQATKMRILVGPRFTSRNS